MSMMKKSLSVLMALSVVISVVNGLATDTSQYQAKVQSTTPAPAIITTTTVGPSTTMSPSTTSSVPPSTMSQTSPRMIKWIEVIHRDLLGVQFDPDFQWQNDKEDNKVVISKRKTKVNVSSDDDVAVVSNNTVEFNVTMTEMFNVTNPLPITEVEYVDSGNFTQNATTLPPAWMCEVITHLELMEAIVLLLGGMFIGYILGSSAEKIKPCLRWERKYRGGEALDW